MLVDYDINLTRLPFFFYDEKENNENSQTIKRRSQQSQHLETTLD
jgi:hypothetical protein